jgi:hypothetical protein
VLISPRDGAPRVGWHRSRISVRGHKDWKPNTTYTVTMLPGISDLRGNSDKTGVELVFSTGPEIASQSISGVVFDWPAGHPAPNAIVEAVSHPDSVVYIGRADSLGHFRIPHMPPGSFTVFGWIDANSNHDRDPHELQDSSTITLKDTATVELLAFIHDSIGPHVVTVEVRDSVTVHASFDKAVDPKQVFDSGQIVIRDKDSSFVPIKAIVSAREIDRRRNDSTAKADSIRARTDTAFRRQYLALHRVPTDTLQRNALKRAAALAALLPSKPIPISDVLITVGTPLKTGTQYRLESKDLRNLMGITATSVRSFDVPKPPPPPPPPRPGSPQARNARPGAPAAKSDSSAKSAVPMPSTPPDTARKVPPR